MDSMVPNIGVEEDVEKRTGGLVGLGVETTAWGGLVGFLVWRVGLLVVISMAAAVGAGVSISMGAGVKTASMGAGVNFWVGDSVATLETTGAAVTTSTDSSKSPIGLNGTNPPAILSAHPIK
jgi:hypothetical protein